jgi:hypothetical protein
MWLAIGQAGGDQFRRWRKNDLYSLIKRHKASAPRSSANLPPMHPAIAGLPYSIAF